jgi:hypothetical protein
MQQMWFSLQNITVLLEASEGMLTQQFIIYNLYCGMKITADTTIHLDCGKICNATTVCMVCRLHNPEYK